MLHRIYIYRIYVYPNQEDFVWVWVCIYPVFMYFVGLGYMVLAACYHTCNPISLL